jgi:calreticulin
MRSLIPAVALGEVFFQEEFGSGWRDRWVDSTWKSGEGTQGNWDVAAPKWSRDVEADSGLKTMEDAKFFGISTEFEPFSNEGKDLVLQFQVKHEQDIECGGGYMKLGPKPDDLSEFGDPTKYYIMFGPDQCGTGSKRVHLIFHYKGKNILRRTDIPWNDDHMTHLLTLHLKPDNTYEVFVDQQSKAKGNLKDDFDFLAPKKIDDPAQSKPSDWVDEEEIDDPNDTKPADWVDGPEEIPDPDASQPEDWDAEEDGEWEAPKVPNPEYKGEWSPKRIPNPDYKGAWEHPQIDNPDYVDDDTVYMFNDISFLGFDLWQVKGGSIFDNIILTSDLSEAEELAKRTWMPLSELEAEEKKKEEDKQAKEAEEAAANAPKDEPADEDDDMGGSDGEDEEF